MKLSEAIRGGCQDTTKGKGVRPPRGSCCALAAAARVVVAESDIAEGWVTIADRLFGLYPYLKENDGALWKDIVTFNDRTEMSREEIANLLSARGL